MLFKDCDYQFLLRVFMNGVSPEEKEYFQTWLLDSDENKEKYSDLILIWEKAGEFNSPLPPDKNIQWAKIEASISLEEDSLAETLVSSPAKNISSINNFNKAKPPKKSHSAGIWIVRLAAIILIAITALFVIDRSDFEPPAAANAEQPAVQSYTWTTSKGEKATIPLSDGTMVYLNASSRLTYPDLFAGGERIVELQGEGYFVIAQDKLKPFKVEINNIIAEAVGTEFNIRSRRTKTQIVVTDGKVKSYYKDLSSEINLGKGDLLTYSKENGFGKPKRVDINRYIAWRKNKLSFFNTPLSEVMNEIEIYYNVNAFIIDKNDYSRRLTGVFQADSLDDVLTAISISMDLDIKRIGKKIIVE